MQGTGNSEPHPIQNGWLGSSAANPQRIRGYSSVLGARLSARPQAPLEDCGELTYRLCRSNQAAGAKHISSREVGSGTNDVTVPLPTP